MSAFRTFLITFIASLLIFGVFAAVISGLLSDALNSLINGSPNETDDSGSSVIDPDNKTPDELEGDSFTLLIIGTDYQPDLLSDYDPAVADSYPALELSEPDYNRGLSPYNYRKIRADAILLVRVNKEDAQISYTYLPSNMQLTVGGAETLLGDLWQEQGLDFFKDEITALTGWAVDYYVIADISGCVDVVNLIDGITYEVPCDMQYRDPAQNLTISLTRGVHRLTGEQVLQLLRYDGYTDGTNTRAKTTVEVARTIADKATNIIYFNRAPALYDTVLEHVTTDFTADVLLSHLDLIFAYSSFNVFELNYPGSYTEFDGATYFVPSVTQALKTFAANK